MKRLIVIGFIIVFGFTVAVTLKLDGNFNNGDRTVGGKLSVANPLTDSGAVLTTSYAVTGYALQFTIASNDHTLPYYPRSEYIITKNGADSAVADDYFGFNITCLNWSVDSRQGLFTQSFTPAFPVAALWFTTISGQPWFQFVTQVDTTIVGDGNMNLYNPTTNPTGTTRQTKYNIAQIVPNQMYRFDFKRKWRADYTGQLEVWLNKILVLTINGANTIRPYNPSIPRQPVDRVGIYWFGAKDNDNPLLVRKAVFDNVSVGRSTDMTWEQYLNYYSSNPTTIYAPWRVE